MSVASVAELAGETRLAELAARVATQDEQIQRLDATLRALTHKPANEPATTDTQWIASASTQTPAVIPWPIQRTSPPRTPAPPPATTSPDGDVLSATADLVPEAVVGVDLNTTIRAWNRAATLLFGWSSDEMLGRKISFVPDDKIDEHTEMVCRAQAVGEVNNILTIRRRRDGDLIRVRASAIPTPNGGAVFTYRTTEIANETLPESDPVAGRFISLGRALAGVAHDFNNLLSVIQGHAELLAEQSATGSPVHVAAETIATATDMAAGLTRHLLCVARPEPTTPPRTDVNLLLGRMLRLLRAIVGARSNVVLTTTPELGLAGIHPADLTQVILNLTTNARDAMTDGGTLTVRTASQVVGPDRHGWPAELALGEFVVLTVSDTGAGMDESIRSRMFDAFFTTKEENGTGLGLATVHEIIERSQGHIEVESERGWGTQVRVYLRRV